MIKFCIEKVVRGLSRLNFFVLKKKFGQFSL